jgi:TatD DNase family protein
MPLIDSHAHLTYPELSGQIDALMGRAAEAGIAAVISIGTDAADARRAIDLAERYPGRVYAGAGFHPHHADKVKPEDFGSMQELWAHPRVIALGEMGLDYHYDFSERGHQQRVFARQLEMARGVDKAVVIHCREAFADCVPMLLEHDFAGRRVVFHCFAGTAEEAALVAEHGWRISFTGIVTFPKSTDLQRIAREYPAEKLMVETDSPYLSPVPVRSKRPNEPAFVAHVARFLAELRGVSFHELADQTCSNTREFFRFPPAE